MRKSYFSGTWRSKKLFEGARKKIRKNKQNNNQKQQPKKKTPKSLAITLIIKNIYVNGSYLWAKLLISFLIFFEICFNREELMFFKKEELFYYVLDKKIYKSLPFQTFFTLIM